MESIQEEDEEDQEQQTLDGNTVKSVTKEDAMRHDSPMLQCGDIPETKLVYKIWPDIAPLEPTPTPWRDPYSSGPTDYSLRRIKTNVILSRDFIVDANHLLEHMSAVPMQLGRQHVLSCFRKYWGSTLPAAQLVRYVRLGPDKRGHGWGWSFEPYKIHGQHDEGIAIVVKVGKDPDEEEPCGFWLEECEGRPDYAKYWKSMRCGQEHGSKEEPVIQQAEPSGKQYVQSLRNYDHILESYEPNEVTVSRDRSTSPFGARETRSRAVWWAKSSKQEEPLEKDDPPPRGRQMTKSGA